MAVQLTPLGKAVVFTVKWIAVPLLFVLIGYKVIGPNMAGPPKAKSPSETESVNMPVASGPGKPPDKTRAKNN